MLYFIGLGALFFILLIFSLCSIFKNKDNTKISSSSIHGDYIDLCGEYESLQQDYALIIKELELCKGENSVLRELVFSPVSNIEGKTIVTPTIGYLWKSCSKCANLFYYCSNKENPHMCESCYRRCCRMLNISEQLINQDVSKIYH